MYIFSIMVTLLLGKKLATRSYLEVAVTKAPAFRRKISLAAAADMLLIDMVAMLGMLGIEGRRRERLYAVRTKATTRDGRLTSDD